MCNNLKIIFYVLFEILNYDSLPNADFAKLYSEKYYMIIIISIYIIFKNIIDSFNNFEFKEKFLISLILVLFHEIIVIWNRNL